MTDGVRLDKGATEGNPPHADAGSARLFPARQSSGAPTAPQARRT